MKYQALLWMLVFTLFISCTNDRPEFENLDDHITYLIEDNRYEEALGILAEEESGDPSVRVLYERTHLNYGLYNMHTFDEREMRTRMNDALRQFIEVLKINPENRMAGEQIDQILQIYSTIPNRHPEEDVVAGLREVGYTIPADE